MLALAIAMSDLFASTPQQIDLKDGQLSYYPEFLPVTKADELLTKLQGNVAWQQDWITIGGRRVQIPRLNAWYGDSGANYSYSGLQLSPNLWLPELDTLRTELAKLLGETFNSALLNLYRDGNDSVSWHSDDEPELGRNPLIASVSLGQTRTFQLKPKAGGSKLNLPLQHGSLLVMSGATQHHWQHQIPKQRGVTEPRINLTFRQIIDR